MDKKIIMTVDDSLCIRQNLSFALKEAGYEVIEAVDGKDAISKLKGLPVHLILADVNMPNLNGIELIRWVRSNPTYKFVPIIMLTAEAQLSVVQEGKAAGATGWIIKPFQPYKLLSIVKKVLG